MRGDQISYGRHEHGIEFFGASFRLLVWENGGTVSKGYRKYVKGKWPAVCFYAENKPHPAASYSLLV
jgi:hypothetical protein